MKRYAIYYGKFLCWIPKSESRPRRRCNTRIFKVVVGHEKAMQKLQRDLAAQEKAAQQQLHLLKEEQKRLQLFQIPLQTQWDTLHQRVTALKDWKVRDQLSRVLDLFEDNILKMKREEYRLHTDMKGYVLKAIEEAEQGLKASEPLERVTKGPYIRRCSTCQVEMRGSDSGVCQGCRNDAYDYP